MIYRYIGKAIFAVSAALVLFTTASCTYYGPPPHAPAHGYRWHVHDYYYYPSAHVYYHIHTGYYYYRSSGVWIRAKVLPQHIHIQRHDRVKIRTKNKRPYLRHDEHRSRYKPKKRLKTDRRYSREEREYNRKRHRKYGERAEKYERQRDRHEKRWKRRQKQESESDFKKNRNKRRHDDR